MPRIYSTLASQAASNGATCARHTALLSAGTPPGALWPGFRSNMRLVGHIAEDVELVAKSSSLAFGSATEPARLCGSTPCRVSRQVVQRQAKEAT